MHADHRYLWPLLLLSFYSTLVDFVRADPLPIPKTYWFDITCLRKGLNDANIKESVQMASAGASRLLNENDRYQSWVYQKLLNRIRDTRVITPTQTWKVVGMCDLRYHLRCCKMY